MRDELTKPSDYVLPGPSPSAFDTVMASLPTLWGRLMRDSELKPRDLERAITEAETLSGSLIAEVLEQGQIATAQERATFLRMLVSAWPNASQNDLAGYGLQLAQDVEAQRPSRYALIEAGKHLRRTSRFLPSICEVLEAIETPENRMRSVLRTLDRIPAEVERAKAKLAKPVREFGQPRLSPARPPE